MADPKTRLPLARLLYELGYFFGSYRSHVDLKPSNKSDIDILIVSHHGDDHLQSARKLELLELYSRYAEGSKSDEPPSQRRLMTLLDRWARALPARIVNEELGDWLEVIDARLRTGKNVRLQVFAAVISTGFNASLYALKALWKRRAG